MAANITKAPLFRTAVRGYSQASAKCVPVGGLTEYDIKCTALPNKVVVAAADNEAAISRVSVLFRAGSRNETPDNVGVTHVLRVCAGLTTKSVSQFAITRNVQQEGASLVCATDREVVAYTLEGTRSAVEKCLPYLLEVSSNQLFRPWEVTENEQRLRLELATRPPQLRAIDLLHKAAYRNRGLGNSLYITKYQIGKISTETLQHYVANNFKADRCAVVGLGVSANDLQAFAQSLPLDSGSSSSSGQSAYVGGEIRSDKGGDLAHIAIAGQGGGLRNAKDALSFAVLQRALGAGSVIKYNNQNKGPLAQIVGKSLPPTSVTSLNVSYADSGLLGAFITAPAEKAGEIVGKVAGILKSGSISDEDIKRGKNQLKSAVLLALESGTTAIEDIGNQAVLNGTVANANQIVTAIDGLQDSDIKSALQKVASKPLAIASVGNLKTVPYLADL